MAVVERRVAQQKGVSRRHDCVVGKILQVVPDRGRIEGAPRELAEDVGQPDEADVVAASGSALPVALEPERLAVELVVGDHDVVEPGVLPESGVGVSLDAGLKVSAVRDGDVRRRVGHVVLKGRSEVTGRPGRRYSWDPENRAAVDDPEDRDIPGLETVQRVLEHSAPPGTPERQLVVDDAVFGVQVGPELAPVLELEPVYDDVVAHVGGVRPGDEDVERVVVGSRLQGQVVPEREAVRFEDVRRVALPLAQVGLDIIEVEVDDVVRIHQVVGGVAVHAGSRRPVESVTTCVSLS